VIDGIDLEISYEVEGKPQSWQRARTGAGRFFTPVKVLHAKKAHAVIAGPLAQQSMWDPEWPVALTCAFFFPITKSWPKWKREQAEREELPHVFKPDLDNLVKLVKDALSHDKAARETVVWRDDCLVAKLTATKWYSPRPRTVVTVARL
jgi:Holliday junction resolvase RusA-like endonuclease